MASRIPVSVVTPERPTWEGEVDALTLPAYDGQMGILPGHAPLLAQLVPGTVLMRIGEETRLLAVTGGFVEVHNGRVALFAESAELAEEIDAERARHAADKARSALKASSSDKLDAAAVAALERALARLRALELASRRGARGNPPNAAPPQ